MNTNVSNASSSAVRTLGELFNVRDPKVSAIGFPVNPNPGPLCPEIEPSYEFQEDHVRRLLLWIGGVAGRTLLIHGPTGCGKSSLVEQLCARLGKELYRVPCHAKMEFSELTGQMTLLSDGSTKFVYGALPRAMSNGSVLLLDEINFMPGGVVGALNTVLDGGPLLLSETGELIRPHSDFRICATGNAIDRGDDSSLYKGTQSMNLALMQRFLALKADYLPVLEEAAMLNRENQSRAAIQSFFVELTGDSDVHIGEGGFVDAYDSGGISQSLRPEEFHSFRRQAFHDIRNGKADRIASVRDRVTSFVNSLRFKRPASSLGQKCGMDRHDSIAVDLKGNVLTCQNVSATALAPNGESHRIGHTSQLDQVALRTATHWSHRSECPNCPMLQICKGACMFLEGPLWEVSCNNAYSDALPIFAAGIEFLTGLVPVYIEGDLPDARKDVFGFVHPTPADGSHKAKPFPIPVVAA
jgi:radical SAM protein with 4Fe4S-binding SPASM domain